MACGAEILTAKQQEAKEKELRELERLLAEEEVRVTIDRLTKKVRFQGWETPRTGAGHWHDDCAYRKLMSEGSSALRMAVARMSTTEKAQLATN